MPTYCRKASKQWQEHERWLSAFETLRYRRATARTIVLGDHNQRIPRRGQNKRVYEALRCAFKGFTFITAGWLADARESAIDHIAHTPASISRRDLRKTSSTICRAGRIKKNDRRPIPNSQSDFGVLNDWRHLPFYSLETRAAPFFAVFMREILAKHFGREFHEVLIPEFPLRIGTLESEKEREQRKLGKRRRPSQDQSYNVDYVAFQADKSTAYLVELKTDMDSIRPAQMDYLCKARKKKFPSLVEGVKQIVQKSNKKQKYINLLHRLSALGIELVYIRPDSRIFDKTLDRVVAGWTSEQ